MILIVLAAGRGSRLNDKTKNLPKCLVKVNNKPIIYFLINFKKYFSKTIFVCGYKYKKIIKNFSPNENNLFILNKNYKKTNMVYSLFCVKKNLIKKKDIVVCYSDIIFDYKIISKLKKIKKTHIPINLNWFENWKKRMSIKQIKVDAEELEISKKNIKCIGNQIQNELPKYQFMGIIKILNKDFFKLQKYFKSLKNNKIEFTKFLNLAIQNKIIKLNYFKSKHFWYEIDSIKDLKVAEKELI